MSHHEYATRRRFLRTAAVATVTVGAVGTGAAQQTSQYLLGGRTSGWVGRQPQSIDGETNPPLRLEPGQQYELTWINVDGAPHNFVIQNGEGETLVRSEVISEEGARQTVTFTAKKAMTEYYCEVHPNSMRGPIEFQSAQGAANQTQTTRGADETGTPAEVDTVTTTGGSQAGQAGQVDAAQETTTGAGAATQTTPPAQAGENATQTTPAQTTAGNATTANETTETATPIGTFTAEREEGRQTVQTGEQPTIEVPGFGALTTLAGIASGAAYLFARSNDEE